MYSSLETLFGITTKYVVSSVLSSMLTSVTCPMVSHPSSQATPDANRRLPLPVARHSVGDLENGPTAQPFQVTLQPSPPTKLSRIELPREIAPSSKYACYPLAEAVLGSAAPLHRTSNIHDRGASFDNARCGGGGGPRPRRRGRGQPGGGGQAL